MAHPNPNSQFPIPNLDLCQNKALITSAPRTTLFLGAVSLREATSIFVGKTFQGCRTSKTPQHSPPWALFILIITFVGEARASWLARRPWSPAANSVWRNSGRGWGRGRGRRWWWFTRAKACWICFLWLISHFDCGCQTFLFLFWFFGGWLPAYTRPCTFVLLDEGEFRFIWHCNCSHPYMYYVSG